VRPTNPSHLQKKGSSLLADRAADELGDDVEVPEMAGVFLQQVEQNPLEWRRLRPLPSWTGHTGRREFVTGDDGDGNRIVSHTSRIPNSGVGTARARS
jgi:hypothetical protein